MSEKTPYQSLRASFFPEQLRASKKFGVMGKPFHTLSLVSPTEEDNPEIQKTANNRLIGRFLLIN